MFLRDFSFKLIHHQSQNKLQTPQLPHLFPIKAQPSLDHALEVCCKTHHLSSAGELLKMVIKFLNVHQDIQELALPAQSHAQLELLITLVIAGLSVPLITVMLVLFVLIKIDHHSLSLRQQALQLPQHFSKECARKVNTRAVHIATLTVLKLVWLIAVPHLAFKMPLNATEPFKAFLSAKP